MTPQERGLVELWQLALGVATELTVEVTPEGLTMRFEYGGQKLVLPCELRASGWHTATGERVVTLEHVWQAIAAELARRLVEASRGMLALSSAYNRRATA